MTEYAKSVSILEDSQEASWKVINESMIWSATFSNPWVFAFILNLVSDFELYIRFTASPPPYFLSEYFQNISDKRLGVQSLNDTHRSLWFNKYAQLYPRGFNHASHLTKLLISPKLFKKLTCVQKQVTWTLFTLHYFYNYL